MFLSFLDQVLISKQSHGNKGDAANPAYQSSNPGGTYLILQYFAFPF
jgi:hypothetical protein